MILSKKTTLWLTVVVMLLVAGALILRIDDLSLWPDETFSVIHSSHSLEKLLRDPDTTWPPAYYLLLHGWMQVATDSEFALRTLGAFFGLIGAALLYKIGARLHSVTAGLLGAFAFGTSSYVLSFALELRGYSLLFPVAYFYILCHLRWLARPNARRAALLIIAQVFALYTQFLMVFVVLATGLHILLSKPRHLVRWLLLLLLTGVCCAPLAPQFIDGLRLRQQITGEIPGYLTGPLTKLYAAYSAHNDLTLLVVIIIALGGLVWQRRRIGWATVAWLAGWGIAIPILSYSLQTRVPVYSTRYLAFTLPPVFILIGWGIARVPPHVLRGVGALALIVLALTPWQPYDHRPAPSNASPPVPAFMRFMRDHWRQGDTLLVDPNNHSLADAVAVAYYEKQYLQFGPLPRVSDPAQAGRRLWYMVRQGSETADLQARVQQGRVVRDFWGPWYMATTLYVAPPLTQGIRYGDLGFLGADVTRGPELQASDTLAVTLWWRAERPLADDLSLALHLYGSDGALIAQIDGTPKTDGTPAQLSAWRLDQPYLDMRTFTIPYGARSGTYTLALLVYHWADGSRLTPELLADATRYVVRPDAALTLDTFPVYTAFNIPK